MIRLERVVALELGCAVRHLAQPEAAGRALERARHLDRTELALTIGARPRTRWRP